MKERVFYVVNLDKQRIGILSLFLFALFFSFFFLGVSVGKGRTDSPAQPQTAVTLTPEITKADSQIQNSEETIPLPKSQAMEVPMADIASIPGSTGSVSTQANITNPYYAESSTTKDEEEERKAQVVDLTKPLTIVKKTETKRKEVALRNQSPIKEKRSIRKEAASNEKLYTIQLGAFGTRESAESFVKKVNHEKPKSKAFIIYKNGFFVVQLGKSAHKEDLQKLVSKLRPETKSKAMIVSFIPLNR
jgi:cell division protein FtsN